jgi:hypothetical protein
LQAATARRYERRLLMDERLAQAHRAGRRQHRLTVPHLPTIVAAQEPRAPP